MLYIDKGRYEEGARELESWLEGEPWDNDARCVQAQAYIELRRWDPEVKLLQSVVEKEPGFHRAWASMADLQGRVGQLDVARQCWQEVIRLATEHGTPNDEYAQLGRQMLPQIDAKIRERQERQKNQGTAPQPPPEPPR